MADASGRDQYRVWIDPNGEVWIEDPDRGALPLLEALQPGFRFAGTAWVVPPALLGRTRRIPAPQPWPEDLDGLWALHDWLLEAEPGERGEGPSLLDLKRAIAQRLVRSCVLCEHRCGVDRPAGERGRCKVGAQSYFGEAYVHQGEEREIAPSLCVALTGCSWHCLYCHTHDLINRVDRGTPLAPAAYDDLYAKATAPEVRTLSFVGGNPDHHLVAILDFLAAAPDAFDRPI
ncbi:MAG TPA: 4Fe-4S cluster-binding domain-containing protein, partial [Oscillatoriaceae cyanobacterium]